MAVPASAQAPAGGAVPAGPTVETWYLGVNTGATVVEKFGGVFAGEVGVRVWKGLDLVAEGAWMSNLVTGLQLQNAEKVAEILQQQQGGTATATSKAPSLYGGLGARFVFENRPAGMGRTSSRRSAG